MYYNITATTQMVGELLVANLKLKYPQFRWEVGDCIESEPVIMDFNHDFCFDVLPKLADNFNMEWEVDKYTIHIHKVERLDVNGKKIRENYHTATTIGYWVATVVCNLKANEL